MTELRTVLSLALLAPLALTAGCDRGSPVAAEPTETAVEAPAPSSDPSRMPEASETEADAAFTVTPIEHATAMMTLGDATIALDPVGGAEAFAAAPAAQLVLVTDIHPDHLDPDTLSAVLGEGAALVVPQAVADKLPEALASRATVLANGDTASFAGVSVNAVPMYNLPEAPDAFHPKGRGNGYVLERDGTRIYIAGDTEDVPEMRALTDIDAAFIPMNLPYTMTVEDAADGVLAFAPAQVYPYHYRGTDGLSDVAQFASLVQAGNPGIEVVQLNWYPE